ncbi:acyl-CoA thioesterase [Arthrobacter sp.]|uniref:acyl-CoA thioesterase n=1 Tax=Arthrobacter sp. TaxID=1667 RepID=UPI003A932869
MHMIFRLWLMLLKARRRSRVDLFGVSSLPMRALLTDIDIAGHINNGMYFSIFDLGRFDLMVRAGAWDAMRRERWTPVVQAETITFRKSVVFNQRFSVETRIAGMDARSIYFEQRIVADGEIYVSALICTRLLGRQGPVSNEEILKTIDVEVPADLELPDWATRWRESTALPGSRKPAPHSWAPGLRR